VPSLHRPRAEPDDELPGLLNVLDAIRRLSPRTRLCFPSSRLVYGRTRYLPVDEEHPREALSFYGIHKRTCEEYCEYYGARWASRAWRFGSPPVRAARPGGSQPLQHRELDDR